MNKDRTWLQLFLFLFSFLLTSVANGQFSIVNDNDGFVNVRAMPGTGGKIICQLKNGVVVRETLSQDTLRKNWVSVEFYLSNAVAKNVRAKAEEWMPEVMKNQFLFKGYIAKDRLIGIEGNAPLQRKQTDDQLLLFNKEIKVEFSSGNFQKERHIIRASPDSGVVQIDGHYFMGTDGEIPRTEIKRFIIEINQQKIDVPNSIFSDLYEPNFSGADAYVDKRGNLYIIMYNSDGAGSYNVIFIMDNKKHLTRYVFYAEC